VKEAACVFSKQPKSWEERYWRIGSEELPSASVTYVFMRHSSNEK